MDNRGLFDGNSMSLKRWALSHRVIIRIEGDFGQCHPALYFPYFHNSAAANSTASIFADVTVCLAPVRAQALFWLVLVVGSLPGYSGTHVISHRCFS